MTLCPIALAVSCKKCPVFSLCPLKSVLGDHQVDDSEIARVLNCEEDCDDLKEHKHN